MHTLLKIGASTLIITALSGCIYIDGKEHHGHWESKQRQNRDAINTLKLDSERSEVQMSLGTPDFSEAFRIDDNEYRVLFYRTQRSHSDGNTSRDETTPLVFKNDKLIGWGHETLEQVKR